MSAPWKSQDVCSFRYGALMMIPLREVLFICSTKQDGILYGLRVQALLFNAFSCLPSPRREQFPVSVSEVFRFVLGLPLDDVVFDVL